MPHRTGMKTRPPSKNSLLAIIVFCLISSGLLLTALLTSLYVSGEAVPAGGGATAGPTLNAMADQLFIVVVPAVIVFLVYIAYVITKLTNNLKETNVCRHTNPDCGFMERYFRESGKVVRKRVRR